MKNNTWGKTILSVYKYLDRVSNAIDKLVKENAFNSYYFTGANQTRNGVMQVAERIIELTERKKRLINLRVLTDKALIECDCGSAQILIERYMDGDSSQEIASRHNLNIRTYFRHLVNAEEKFTSIMAKFGFDDKKLSEYLKGEKWIMEVYDGYNVEQENELVAV
ncbi:MAG: hypothetical protein E7379_02370 [Clostridiales bacterium]|nr:hypothetical protein [Clostridiales bacterium]